MKTPMTDGKTSQNRILFISQPIIFQSTLINKSDQILEPSSEQQSTKQSTFKQNETQRFQQPKQGYGKQTERYLDNLSQLEQQQNLLKVRIGQDPHKIQNLDIPAKTQSSYNIFEEANNEERKKFIDYTGGPRFEIDKNSDLKQDKLVKYSVVGYQQFLKVHQEKLKYYQKQKKNQLTDESQIDEIPTAKPSYQPQPNQQRKTPKKKGDQKYVNKRDLASLLRQAKDRIEKTEKEQEFIEEKLPIHFRNAVSREERVLKNFEANKNHWENVKIQVASNCFRQPEETIMQRSDQFRQRNQMIQALELCKGDDEKNNSRYWYLRLRWQDHKDQRPPFCLLTQSAKQNNVPKFENRLTNRFISDPEAERLHQQQQFTLSDIQANFNAKLIDNPFKQVETVISEQNLQQQHAQSPKTRLYSQKLENLYHQKIKEKPKKKFIDSQDYLSLTGEKQIIREERMLRREQGQEFKIVDIPNEEPEIIINTWNHRNLAKSGEYVL